MRAKLILSLLLAASANSCLFAETMATHQTSNQSVILASDYLSDGVSQTDRNPALQWQREDR